MERTWQTLASQRLLVVLIATLCFAQTSALRGEPGQAITVEAMTTGLEAIEAAAETTGARTVRFLGPAVDDAGYEPIPSPGPNANSTSPSSSSGPMIRYDLRTGEKTIIELPDEIKQHLLAYKPRGSIGDTTRSALGEGRAIQTLGMSALTKVQNPTDYPWCVNVRLNTQPSGGGSGVLIDPYWILTAAHCIHPGNGGDPVEGVTVYPALSSEDGCPYGTAEGVLLYIWPGWTQDGDPDHDLALIRLDRAVGALTGYHSYGHEADCDFFTENAFYIPGYPAEGPYEGNNDMYYFYGSFDWCAVLNPNLVEFYTWSQVIYKGQSGSGVHLVDGTQRIVYGVLTKEVGFTPYANQCCRITESKFADISNSILNLTPPGVDFVPLDVRIEPDHISAGCQLSSMSYVVHNYGTSTWIGTVEAEVYLSEDLIIDTDDTLINQHQFSTTLSPKANFLVNVTPAPTIPIDMPDRAYVLGVVIKTSDSNPSNNASHLEDSADVSLNSSSYSVTASAGDHGVVEPSGTTYVSACGGITFNATPDVGYSVDKWFINDQLDAGSEGLGSLTLDNVQQATTVLVTFRIAELIITRPAVSPYRTRDSCPTFRGTAPLNTDHVLWQNVTTGKSGDTEDLPGTTWAVSIDLAENSNTICFSAQDVSGKPLASACIEVIRDDHIREIDCSSPAQRWIVSGEPWATYDGIVTVGCDPTSGYHNMRGLVRLDLDASQFPPGSTVENAIFHARTAPPNHQIGGETMGVIVRRITSSWSEESVSWNTQPGNTTSGQAVEVVRNAGYEVIDWDVTSIAQSWRNGSSIHGLVMISQSEDIPYQLERAFGNSGFRLKINLTIEGEVPLVQITSPTSNPSYATGVSSVSLAGTASDNDNCDDCQVSRVDYVNHRTGESGTASGTTSWSCTVSLESGWNDISVIAYDASDNSDSDEIGVFYLTPPATVSATDDIMDHVSVHWDAVTDVDYYCVYRSERETGVKLAISGWIDALSFLDTSAEPGVPYYYWVATSDDSSGTVQSDYGDDPAIGKRPAPLDPELSGDNIVNFKDFRILASQWMEACSGPNSCGGCDLDLSGEVAWPDVHILADNWLKHIQDIPDDMVPIPGGEFEMGDNVGDGHSDELPVHTVTEDSFYICKFEVTNLEYCDYLNSAASQSLITVLDGVVYKAGSGTTYPYCETSTSSLSSYIVFPQRVGRVTVGTKGSMDMSDHPMVHVTWYGAVAYCNWRSQQEGYEECYDLSTWNCDFSKRGYRLPTEAEWEYAARGGLSRERFPWSNSGDTISHSQANYASSSLLPYDISPTRGYHPTWNDGVYPYTSPVGSFAANGYGLYDMAGNVWDWCNDRYDSEYYGSSPGVNPEGPAGGGSRVIRGGDWDGYGTYCRVSHRAECTTSGPYDDLGFRLVLDLN